MSIKFTTFKFYNKTKEKKFCIYKIISNNPYDSKQAFNGNSVRYQLHQRNRNQFIYNWNNERIVTFKEIGTMPTLLDNVKLELIGKDETIPLTDETLDLYKEWVKYFIFNRIMNFGNINKGKYNHSKENKYKTLILSDKSSGINIRRIFQVDTDVLIDGTAYVSVDVKCEFESKSNIYEYISQGKDVLGLKVTCDWQSYDGTYTITKSGPETINQSIGKTTLLHYWEGIAPWRVKGINSSTPAISVFDEKKKITSLYIPQSLKPIITREYIAKHYKNLSKTVDKHSKLSMKERLKFIKGFLNDLNYKGEIINTDPVDVSEFGYTEDKIDLSSHNLLIGNNKKVSFHDKYKAFNNGYGFYKLPEKPIVAAYLGYGTKDANYDIAKASHKVIQTILSYTRGKIPRKEDTLSNKSIVPLTFYEDKWLNKNMMPLTFYKEQIFQYDLDDKFSYNEIANKIKSIPEINFVISTLPSEKDEEDFQDDFVSPPYDSYKNIFADLDLPSQMVSINLEKDIGTNNLNWKLQNIILGILAKSGGIPWVLESPMDNVDCFIGIDVGTQEKGIHYPACSVCLDGTGKLIAYYSTNIAQKGEKISSDSLQNMLDKTLIAYNNANGRYPEHIVIHRDGFSNEENNWYIEYFRRRGIKFDLVEIRKNISTRLLDKSKDFNGMNPDGGSIVIKDNKAYIISTNVNPSLGSPRPLLVVHRYGELSIKQIATQIYLLSELHIGSMRTSRLPLTVLYADKICKHHNHIPHNVLINKLYFI